MIRYSLLLLFIAFFSMYAWKNWFVSLCSLILLMAVIEHPDFPNSIAGIPGLNPWNILLVSVFFAWLNKRSEHGYEWDYPPAVGKMLLCCLVVVVVGVIRLLLNNFPSGYTINYIITEKLFNTVKWVIPSLMLFDACRTRRRAVIGLGVIIGLYFLFGLQVVRWMPLSEIGGGDELSKRASKITENEIGFNRVTLSMMLAGGSWAALAALPLLKQNYHRLILLGMAGIIAFGQALTGGRTGYVSWIGVGLLLALMRWRKLLLVMPLLLIGIGILVPAARDRMLQGFGGKEGNFTVSTSAYEMTSGRDIAWPVVIEEIGKSPVIGHGREAMTTTGTKAYLLDSYGEAFPHPHQAYLELLIDNGIIGFLLVIPIFIYMLWRSVPILLERNDPLVCAIGCAAFSLVMALMVGALGGQTFYPREGSVGMWAAIGLMLRIYVQTLRAEETGETLFPDELPGKWFVGHSEETDEWIPGDGPTERV
jgi:O-antigen ligase